MIFIRFRFCTTFFNTSFVRTHFMHTFGDNFGANISLSKQHTGEWVTFKNALNENQTEHIRSDSTPFGLIEDSNWENWFRTGNTNERENELISKCEKFRSQFWLNAIDQHSNWLFDWKCDWLSCRSRIWNSIDWPTQRHTYIRSHTRTQPIDPRPNQTPYFFSDFGTSAMVFFGW